MEISATIPMQLLPTCTKRVLDTTHASILPFHRSTYRFTIPPFHFSHSTKSRHPIEPLLSVAIPVHAVPASHIIVSRCQPLSFWERVWSNAIEPSVLLTQHLTPLDNAFAHCGHPQLSWGPEQEALLHLTRQMQ